MRVTNRRETGLASSRSPPDYPVYAYACKDLTKQNRDATYLQVDKPSGLIAVQETAGCTHEKSLFYEGYHDRQRYFRDHLG